MKCIGIEIDYVYHLNVNTFYMPDHRGFYPYYNVFLQMKNENIPFKEIVARLKLVPANILDEWNNQFDSEHPQIDPEHCMYIELKPPADKGFHVQVYHFDNTLDAMRYELDELLFEKAQAMQFDTASADDETFLLMLEETTLFCHRYLTDITITPVSNNNYWIAFTLNGAQDRLVKKAKKLIKFYMKWVFTNKKQLEFSWN